MNTHKYLFRMIFCCLFILVLGGSALAAGEAGQVLEVSGEATLAPGAAKVAAFTKFKPGDVFTLGQNAKLKLVYFANEREESWSGPGSFVAGAQKSEGREGLAA